MDQPSAETFEALSREIITACGHLHGGEYRLIEMMTAGCRDVRFKGDTFVSGAVHKALARHSQP